MSKCMTKRRFNFTGEEDFFYPNLTHKFWMNFGRKNFPFPAKLNVLLVDQLRIKSWKCCKFFFFFAMLKIFAKSMSNFQRLVAWKVFGLCWCRTSFWIALIWFVGWCKYQDHIPNSGIKIACQLKKKNE